MSRQIRVLCGVPKEFCNGTHVISDQQYQSDKAHVSHSDAFNCMVRYLTGVLNYTRVGARDFSPPDGGPVRTLTKKSHYGGLLIFGKEQTRFMPEKRRVGNRGTIV